MLRLLTLAFIIVFTIAVSPAPPLCETADFDHSHRLYGKVLNEYVYDGLVDYSALQSSPELLNAYLNNLGNIHRAEFDLWTENEQKAFLINLYNAAILKFIIDHYPVSSVKKMGDWFSSPWKDKFVQLFGEITTLDFIEHELLRKNFNDPRIHFALVGAAKGYPPLGNKPYTAKKINKELREQGKLFMSQPEKNSIDRENSTLYLSPIFKWFKDDFKVRARTLNAFVSNYFPGRPNLRNYKIKYTDFDWSLNDSSSE